MSTVALGERVASVETKVQAIDMDVKNVAERLDRLQFWIMATFGGVVVGVAMMVLQLLVKR